MGSREEEGSPGYGNDQLAARDHRQEYLGDVSLLIGTITAFHSSNWSRADETAACPISPVSQPRHHFPWILSLNALAEAWSFLISLVGGKGSETPTGIRRRALDKRVLCFTTGSHGS